MFVDLCDQVFYPVNDLSVTIFVCHNQRQCENIYISI